MDTESLTQKTGHLAWCALVALNLARLEGKVVSEAQENLYLIRWLATALKQRRFLRDVTPDIEWLLKQGRALGTAAKLSSKLEYLWLSCTGDLSAQNDLFRLTYGLETAKDMGWVYRLLSDREWAGRHAITFSACINGVYLSRPSLDVAFNDDGGQIAPLLVRLTGNIPGFEKLLSRCGWQAKVQEIDERMHCYQLTSVRRGGEETSSR